jgi:hypothetical protein
VTGERNTLPTVTLNGVRLNKIFRIKYCTERENDRVLFSDTYWKSDKNNFRCPETAACKTGYLHLYRSTVLLNRAGYDGRIETQEMHIQFEHGDNTFSLLSNGYWRVLSRG